MSSFLSNKFLQYRESLRHSGVIDSDLYCTGCGYNVRGLNFGRNCPECGQIIRRSTGLRDPLLSGDETHRWRIWLGLSLVSFCLIAAALARFGIFFVILFTGWLDAPDAYLALGLALSAMWIAGVWMLTSPEMNAHYQKLQWLRQTARWSALLWLPAYVLWMQSTSNAMIGTPAGEGLYGWSLFLRAVAGIGTMFFGAWLLRLSSDAELDQSTRRINLALWMLPLPSLLLLGVPAQVPWIAIVLIGMVLLVWCWYVLLLGRAVLAMQRHVAWARKLAIDAPRRRQRMEQTRRELDQNVAATIRPVPAGKATDVPIEK